MFSSGYTQLDNLPIVNCSSPNVLKVGINIFLVCTVNNKFSAESLCMGKNVLRWVDYRVGILLIRFWKPITCFCEWKSERMIRLWKRVNCFRLSFVMGNLSKSITVTLVLRAMGAICSQSLFFKELLFKKSDWVKSKTSDFLFCCVSFLVIL